MAALTSVEEFRLPVSEYHWEGVLLSCVVLPFRSTYHWLLVREKAASWRDPLMSGRDRECDS
jgi:hypothetical protein